MRTRNRDRLNVASLEADGWRVLTAWECHLRRPDDVLFQIREFLEDSKNKA